MFVMAMRFLSLVTVVVAVCWSSVSGHEAGGLTFEVPDKQKFCFYEEFRNASVYILDYKVPALIYLFIYLL